ncbi:MAG: ABC transporter substrate-binding protein [Treponema sp.]|jgi:branched-chain amino acid transport system substrate-binding protein|nr:ABC transporter substrate-binding protein [Treponema sp.]
MKKLTAAAGVILCAALAAGLAGCSGKQVIKIGFNIPLTGDSPKIGEGAKYAAELIRKDVEAAGGLEVGGVKYALEFIYVDNELKPESAVSAAYRLIEQDKVLAVIGPEGSGRANPAGGVNNELKTPMISPWATNPTVTLDRPYVFRACILDPVQATSAAAFLSKQFPDVAKVAVMYNIDDDYSKGLAEFFREVWIGKKGLDSVAAFESFGQKDQDFSTQLTRIVASEAQMLYLPAYYNHVGLIVSQIKDLGWGDKPIFGSDSWGSADLWEASKGLVAGCYFTTHYAAAGATGATKDFIDAYNAAYGYVPDDVAALSFDATKIILKAVQDAGISGDLKKDRDAIRAAIVAIKDFPGITGSITFNENGDPYKPAVVVRVNEAGEFEFVESL